MSKKTVVIKKPNDNSIISRPQHFPKLPRLYLELIENKSKIKQSLVNEEFILDDNVELPELAPASPVNSDITDDDYSVGENSLGNSVGENSLSNSVGENSFISKSYSDNDSDVKSDGFQNSDDNSSIKSSSVSSTKSNFISSKMAKLLGESDDESSFKLQENFQKDDKYSKPRNRKGYSIDMNKTAPSYAELEATGQYVPKKELRDINTVTTSEKQDEDNKRELLFKFEILRKSYPTSVIPVYTIHTDYQQMLNSYEDCVRRLSLDSTVENYKQYLIYGFMFVEFIFGKFLKFDMEGFTQQQIISMTSYEKLLIELGEKSYIPEGSKWSVEIRLTGLVLVNTAVFIGSKMLMKRTNVNFMGMMNGMMNNNSKPKQKEESGTKMKGPQVDLDDI